MCIGWMMVLVTVMGGVLSGASAAQTEKPQGPDNASSKATQTVGSGQAPAMGEMAQSDEPMSVAEAARLARANKKDSGKAVKSYDDDNFQRSVPITKKSIPEEGGGTSASTGGQAASLDELKGKVVLLDFWASWCGPCRMALPKVKQLQSVYGGGDFVVVSVSEDEDENAWKSFVARNAMTWAQRFDGDSSLMNKYRVEGLPTYVLLGKDGQEVQRYVGEDPGQSVVERIGPDLKNALGK